MKSAAGYFSLLLIFAFANFAQAQKPVANKDLPNFYQINSNLYRGGQPTEAGVKELAKIGVKTIIDLRGGEKVARRERLWVEKAGIRFIVVNLSNWFKPKTADINQILQIIDVAENKPVYVHCRRGANRTGTVIAAYRISRDNWTAKQANREAKKFGHGWWQVWMKDFIEDYEKEEKSVQSQKSTSILNFEFVTFNSKKL